MKPLRLQFPALRQPPPRPGINETREGGAGGPRPPARPPRPAPRWVGGEPFVEISALATECFHQLVTTPHIVVHIGADIYETAKDKLAEIAHARGFAGRPMV